MVMTGAERQRQYRAKAKATEGLATLNIMVATDTRAQLKDLAARLGLTHRETLERIIGEAFTALLSDEQRTPEAALQGDTPLPATALQGDEPARSESALLSDEAMPLDTALQSDEQPRPDAALQGDEPLLSDAPATTTALQSDESEPFTLATVAPSTTACGRPAKVTDPEIVRRVLALGHLSEKKAAEQLQAEGVQIGASSVGKIRGRPAKNRQTA